MKNEINKIIIFLMVTLLPTVSMAGKQLEIEREAIKDCKAFNNMKHTKNKNNISIKTGYVYRILEHRESQVMILIDNMAESDLRQRWVDSDCFYKKEIVTNKVIIVIDSKGHEKVYKPIDKTSIKQKISTQNLLAISWQNAFCQTHKRRQECIDRDENHFGSREFLLHGLWPQPRNNQYCDVDKKEIGKDKNKQWSKLKELRLSPKTRGKLEVLMAGYQSYLHRHEWIKHGTCYGTNADEYYSKSMELLQEINYSKVGEFFTNNINQTVNIKDIRKIFDKEFGIGTGESVDMRCKNGLIIALWLNIGGGDGTLSTLLKKGQKVKSSCNKGEIDALGF